MKVHFRLLLETAFLTVMIWTYADQASYDSYEGFVAVRIDTPADVVATIEGSRGGPAEVVQIPMKLRGPKAAVRKLQMEKGTAANPFTLSVDISDDLEPHVSHIREIYDDVARLPAIRDRGLQLEELSRQTIIFTLDRYVSIPLRVEADAGKFSEALDGKPVIQPETVTVKVLESELKRRGTPEPRRVIPIEESIRTRADETTARFTVPLGNKWEGMQARFEPEQVTVSVQLTRSYERAKITVIPLRVNLPPDIAGGDYEIEWQTRADRLQDIDVRMPIGKPPLANTDVDAYIKIEKSDLPSELLPATTTAPSTEGWIQREIRFAFPPGYQDVQVDGPPRLVKFRIRKKSSIGELSPLNSLP